MYLSKTRKIQLEEQYNLLLTEPRIQELRSRASRWVFLRLARIQQIGLLEELGITAVQWRMFQQGQDPKTAELVLKHTGLSRERTRQYRLLEKADPETAATWLIRQMLEREQRNLEQSMTLCQELQRMDVPVAALDTEAILARMEDMEKGGTSFQNKQEQDIRVRYIAPVIITVVMVALMTCLSVLIFWAYKTAPEESPPVWFLWLTVGVFAAVGGGVVLALTQRIREIGKGEIDDARRY